MKRLLIALILAVIAVNVATAQEVTPEADSGAPVYRALVVVESAFARLRPSQDSEPAASVFEGDILEVVSRNLDGKWFEVRRPYRMTSLGWINNEMVDTDFAPEFLPLGDLDTGAIGDRPLSVAPIGAVFVVEGVALREAPGLRAPRIINIPPGVTVPALERNLDASWLYVNYLGYEGWIIGFAARSRPDILEILPLSPDAPLPETPMALVIPREIQLAQVERLRTYINERRNLSYALSGFWTSVYKGEVMPCEAQPPIPLYAVTDQDVRELPELGRYTPRLGVAVNLMNESLEPLIHCGIIVPSEASDARNDAINATIIFDATLEQLDLLVKNVIP
jgi:hypothetical protein